jgi:sugar phosphate isomerase/epimerase
MYLGFLTVCLHNVPLENLVKWSGEKGFKALEVGCWPQKSDRDFKSSSINVATLTKKKAAEIREIFDIHGLKISSLAYYDNNLHPDKKTRTYVHNHLHKVIDAAELLGVDLVGTFVGRDPNFNQEECFKQAQKIFKGHLAYARKKKVRLMIENCPMMGWQRPEMAGNLLYSPESWEKMYKLCPDDNFGLNLDPSHLFWLGIDYVDVIKPFKNRIFHVHAKDTEINQDKLKIVGILGHGWWRYRMPGLGEINWSSFVSALQENGYDSVLSTEHEDPVYHGSEEKVKKGLMLGQKYLSQYVI